MEEEETIMKVDDVIIECNATLEDISDGSVSKGSVSLFPIGCTGTPSEKRSLTNACIKSVQILSASTNVDPLVSMQVNNSSMVQPLIVPITRVDEELSLDKRVMGGK